MPHVSISHFTTGKILFGGRFENLRSCVEQAVADGADLSGADLRHANLGNADLDMSRLDGARLDHANLCGANLSEAVLIGGTLRGASLQNACLCDADLTGCDFTGCQFGATDIAGAHIVRARFSTLSALSLNFTDAGSLEDCVFVNEPDGVEAAFSRPPVNITGLRQHVCIFDRHIRIGAVIKNSIDLIRPAAITDLPWLAGRLLACADLDA